MVNVVGAQPRLVGADSAIHLKVPPYLGAPATGVVCVGGIVVVPGAVDAGGCVEEAGAVVAGGWDVAGDDVVVVVFPQPLINRLEIIIIARIIGNHFFMGRLILLQILNKKLVLSGYFTGCTSFVPSLWIILF
jgi:hypothetical protein